MENKVYIFLSDNVLFFFSDLFPGVTYLVQVFSREMANQVVNNLEKNNVTYLVGAKNFLTEIEEKKIKASNPNNIIYYHIQTQYDLFTTTNSSFIYKHK